MQDNGSKNIEKLRDFYRGAVEAFGWLFWSCYRFAVATVVIYAAMMLAGLLTADPETATFRDFLLAMRAPAVWTGSAVLAMVWIGLKLILFPPRYPTMAAAFSHGKASGSRSKDLE